jgi:hypothetical protein
VNIKLGETMTTQRKKRSAQLGSLELEAPNRSMKSDVYVNMDGARIILDTAGVKTFKLQGVSDPSTICFDPPVSYSVHPINYKVAVTTADDVTVLYKTLVSKVGKFVTVTDDKDNLITKTYKEMVESNKKDYEVTIHSDLNSQETQLSYINSDITWYPSVTIKLDGDVAYISYVAVLKNDKAGYEGNYFISTLEAAVKEKIYKNVSRMNGLPVDLARKNEDVEEENDNSVTLGLGPLNFKDILVVPIEDARVEYVKMVFVDMGLYDDNDSSSQLCQEGFSFVTPFYLPSAKASIYAGSFFTNAHIKTHHKKQLFFNRMYRSKQVSYLTTHTENTVVDKSKYKDIDFNTYIVTVHTWKIFFTNNGPEVECLITLSGLGDIVDSVPKTLKGLEQPGRLKTTCIIMGNKSSNITLTVVKKQRNGINFVNTSRLK